MSDTPELDQVVDARRKLAAYAAFSRTYWVLLAIALVLMAGLPIWMSFLPGEAPYLQWVLLAVALAAAAHAVLSRRGSGVHLPRRAGAYPSARWTWLAVLLFTLAGFLGINALVDDGRRGLALIVLVPVAAIAFVGQLRIRAKMREDIEAGRVEL